MFSRIFMRNISNFLSLYLLLTVSLAFGQSDDDRFYDGELYVRLENSFSQPKSMKAPDDVLSFFEQFSDEFQITEIKAGFFFAIDNLRNTYRIRFQNHQETEQFIKELENEKSVVYAEKIPKNRFHDFPNDLGPNTTGNNGQYYLYKIQAPAAWDILNQGNSNIKIAVVDDACETTHPELVGNIIAPYNAVTGTTDVEPTNNNWDHGTFISGLIAANTNNEMGMASLGRGLSVLPIRVTDSSNPNNAVAGFEGISYAISQGVDVINISWGSEDPSQTGIETMNSAYNAGIVTIASAGNDNSSNVVYPAAYPNVISVASTTQIDTKSTFSSYGTWIDICAPGSLLWSLSPSNSYTVKDGTSFSAPLVSATVGLMLSINPELTPDEVRSCLLSSCDNINLFNPDYLGLLGAGRLNVQNALLCVNSEESPYDVWLSEIISPSVSSCQTSAEHQIRVVNSGLDTLFSMNIRWQIDDGFALTEPWNDTLAPGQAVIITLPQIEVTPGNHTLKVTILNQLNGDQMDAYPSDNVIVFPFEVLTPTGITLPFQETFETGNFNTNGWTNINQESDFGWEIAVTSGTAPGTRSARLPYYIDFQTGTRDYLVSPTFNLSGYSSVNLGFEFAYQQRTQGLTDSLILSVSSDCGENWVRIFAAGENNFNSFATVPLSGSFFIPQLPEDWCVESSFNNCVNLDLSGFAGMTGVRFRFEGYNGSGNNIYIDNINVTGELAEVLPVADFNANGNLQVCLGEPVLFTNTSYNNPTEYQWSLPGAIVDSSEVFSPLVLYPDTGSYDVELIVSNTLGSDTLLLESYITVLPIPEIFITIEPDSVCKGTGAQLEASNGIAYFWSAAPGLEATYSQSVSVSPQNTTNYVVTGLSALGCTNTASATLTVINPPQTPTISQQDTILISSPANSYQWFVNGLEIEGATSQLHVPQVNGNYNVRIFNDFGCTSISNPFNVTGVSIEHVQVNSLIQVFPNPADRILNLEANSPIEEYVIFDSTGRLIMQVSANKSLTLAIQIDELVSGIYTLRIQTQQGIQSVLFTIFR